MLLKDRVICEVMMIIVFGMPFETGQWQIVTQPACYSGILYVSFNTTWWQCMERNNTKLKNWMRTYCFFILKYWRLTDTGIPILLMWPWCRFGQHAICHRLRGDACASEPFILLPENMRICAEHVGFTDKKHRLFGKVSVGFMVVCNFPFTIRVSLERDP